VIELWLNNEKCVLTHNTTLSDALTEWKDSGLIRGNAFAIAINTLFVPRSSYTDPVLANGDRIDLVVPMQGG
jgi:sulfur carrier protein